MKNAGSKKIAERYVNAGFEIANKSGALAAIEKDLLVLADLIKENPDFRAFLRNPLLSRAAQSEIAIDILKKLNSQPFTAQFVDLLASNKRLDILSEAISQFLEKIAASRGEMSAELISAKPVSAKESALVADSLAKVYNKKVNLKVREDSSLLGGTIINIGSKQLDSSLAGKLNRLKLSLKAA